MNKMPDRIWATPYDADMDGGTYCDAAERPTSPNHDAWCYVRADIVSHVNEMPKSEHECADMLKLSVQPNALHRSFPEAGDGRPFPPMMDELITAGLNAEDARFVAVQLKQNGYSLTKESKSLFGLAGEP